MSEEQPVNGEIFFYGTPTCPMVPPVRGMLQRAGAPFVYVDIGRDPAGRQRVLEINQGNASVPTLVFADGTTLTEPSRGVLRAKLVALGYAVPRPGWVQAVVENPLLLLLGLMFIAIGLVGGEWWLAAAGAALLVGGAIRSRYGAG